MRVPAWVAVWLLAAAVASAAGPEAAAIAARRASMQGAGEVMRGLRLDILAHRPVGALAGRARWVAQWAEGVPALFPPGSGQGDPYALPNIWTDQNGFAAMAARLRATTLGLVATAEASDAAGFRAAYVDVDDACNQCHRIFRLR